MRLACQLRPTGDISVEPILQVEQSRWITAPPPRPPTEREVALLFFDLRFAADRARGSAQAHDTIYALGRFQTIIDAALDTAGGLTCRRTGDHWLALFGLDSTLQEGCRRAVAAARRIEQQATALCERLRHEVGLHADFTVGLHAGVVVAGMTGEGEARSLSAVGEAMEATAGLRGCAAGGSVPVVMSRQAASAAGMDTPDLRWRPVGIDVEGSPMLWTEVPAATLAAP